MSNLAGYQKWLMKQQRQPIFMNSFWCASLAYDMEENRITESFKIPYFIVEEELTREDNNFIQQKESDGYTSNQLRHFLIHLLKPYNDNVNVVNYEEILRAFLSNEGVLPNNVACPLSTTTSFHNLPSECKLWILCKLRDHCKPSRSPRAMTKDALGNAYYIVPGCRIYVRLAASENDFHPIDEAHVTGQPWESLNRFLRAQPCLLLCENHNEWEAVWKLFQSFRMDNLHYSLRPEMIMKISGHNQVMVMRDVQRKEFGDVMRKLTPIPKARTIKSSENVTNAAILISVVDVLKSEVEEIALNEPIPPATPKQTKPKPRSSKRVEKCWQFPQCPLDFRCPYVHPKFPCTKFPNCSRGWECIFLHDICSNDEDCEEPNCAYEHYIGKPTYYRLPRGTDNENPRPVAAVPPTVRDVSEKAVELPKVAITAGNGKINSAPQEKRKRCQYFPQCPKGNKCRFVHPVFNCKKLAAGEKCNLKCLFKHGPCPIDGSCQSFKCIYEHIESKPVIERIMDMKKKQQGGSLSRAPSIADLSRATSMSNLSTISARSSGRRKSVTFDFDSDGESMIANPPSKKESTDTPPVGILRPSGINSLGRCAFFPRCTNEACEYTHPMEKCPAFPECPNGGACIFLHETCENDGVCSKTDCDFMHYRPHEIDNTWCRNGSRCNRVKCKFLHPKECTAPCPTPGECWMYHRPGVRANQPQPPLPSPQQSIAPETLNNQRQPPGHGPQFPPGPGFQGAPGYGPVPPFAQQGGYAYGYAPNYGPQYLQGPYGPGPGYYGPPHNFGNGQGYWQGPQHGGYGQHPGYDPRAGNAGPGYPPPGQGGYTQRPYDGPAAPLSASLAPPPPYPNLTPEERQLVDRKNRIAEDRYRGDDFTRL